LCFNFFPQGYLVFLYYFQVQINVVFSLIKYKKVVFGSILVFFLWIFYIIKRIMGVLYYFHIIFFLFFNQKNVGACLT